MRTRSGEGWGQLPRAIARALASGNLNWYEGNLMWAIVYKTIAFNKEEDKIPKSQMSDLTGINKRHLSRTINSLLKKGVIFRRGNIYGVQRDFAKWENTPNQVYKEKKHLIRDKMVPIQGKNTPDQVPSRDPSKRTIQEKGLSTSLGEEQRKKFMEGLHGLMKDIGSSPGKKKEKYRLIKKSQNKEK
jgi:phage replication O-like protein O